MRELKLEEFVDEIYEDYINNKDTTYVFFLGAGCSSSSGIPLASELAKKWHEELKKQKTKYENFNNKKNIDDKKEIDYGTHYFDIFEVLFPTPLMQQKEIQKITEEKIPSLGYYVLSKLMQKPQFNTVITTNFDNLIQDALIYSGNKRALVITHEDLAKFIKRDNTPLITKIHGDAHLHPFNNTKDTKKIPEELKEAIQGLFINSKLIFIGYKGNDESICDLLLGCKRIDQVYWFGSSDPESSKLKDWWKGLEVKTFIKERDFDKIMSLIKSKFDIKKPDFKKRFEVLENSYSNAENEEINEIELIEENQKTYIDYFILANNYYSQKDYFKSIESYKKAIEINSKFDSAYNNWGTALSDLAKIKDDENLYKESFEKYAKAIEINSKYDSAYFNWGTALSDLAEIKDDENLYKESFEKYAKAIEINSKYDSAYFNWGNALLGLAKIKDDENLYKESFEKYAKAIEINSKYDSAYNNWGNALSDLAKIKDDENLYKESFEKYAKAIEINSKFDSAYNNWGTALSDLAKIKDDENLYKESFEKYAKAIEINSKFDSAYFNWGTALSGLAKIKDDENLYKESFEKYAKAIEINSKYDSAYFNWGNALSGLAKIKDDENLYKESFEKYAKAIEINSKYDSAYNNWGTALSDLAKIKDDENLYKESFEKLIKAFELNSKAYNLSCFYAIKNEKDNALKYLEISLKNKEITSSFVLGDEDWNNFRSDKKFVELIEKYK